MATESDFTPDEWELLGSAPLTGGAAIALASTGSPEAHAAAIVKGWREAGASLTQNALIQELVRDQDPALPAIQKRSSVATAGAQSGTDLAAQARLLCDRAVALLTRKASTTDVQDYQAFVLRLANAVARTTKEGGFLGFGGEEISRAEHGVLRQLAAGLRYDG